MGKLDSYLSHAVTPPSLEAIQAPRPRLIKALKDKLGKRLILISAPAGYGKTTLLAEFTLQADLPASWVRLTEADQDVMRLAEVLWTSLTRRFRRLRGVLRIDSLAGASPKALARAITEALAESVAEPFLVIFDDVHWLNGTEEASAFLAALIEFGPAGMTVIAGGRELPNVPLVDLLASDRLATFDADNLALRADELADVVMRRTGEDVPEAVIGDLMEETGGWVTGVLLSERLVSHQVPSLIPADEPLAYEYLASAVFDRQPNDVQRFLLDSSVLPVMTAELCDAVLERKDSQEMLDDLLRRGIFISVTDDDPRSYEYHQLFRRFLHARSRIIDLPRHRNGMIRAASQLSKIDEWVEEAVELLIVAEEPSEAKNAVLNIGDRLLQKGRLGTLRRWSKYFHLRNTPVPSLDTQLATLLEAFGHRQEVLDVLDLAANASSELSETELHLLQRRILTNQGFLGLRNEDWDGLKICMNSLTKLLEKYSDPVGHQALYRLQAFFAADHLGDRASARQMITAATEQFADRIDPMSSGLAWTTRAYIETYNGDLSSAEASAEMAVGIFRSCGILYGQQQALMDLAYIQHLRGKFESAFYFLEQAKESSHVLGSSHAEDTVSLTEIEMTSELGHLKEARNQLRRVRASIVERQGYGHWEKYAFALEACLARRDGDVSGASKSIRLGFELKGANRNSRLVTERLGLFSVLDPDQVLGEVWRSRKNVPFTEQDRTLLFYFLGRACFSSGKLDKAVWWANTALRRASSSGAIQMLAAELDADREFDKFLGSRRSKLHGLVEVAGRLSNMAAAKPPHGTPVASLFRGKQGMTLNVLGPAELAIGDLRLPSLSPQELRLLVLLVERGHERSEALGELFWPGSSPDRQMSSLHTAIYHLRRALGGNVIKFASGQYWLLHRETVNYDVRAFVNGAVLLARANPSRVDWFDTARKTLDIYKGPFMAGHDERWVLERRAELESIYIDTVANLARNSRSRDKAEAALPYLRKALKIDPYQETVNQLYVNLLNISGRQVARALHVRRYHKLLREDLGIDTTEALGQD